VSIQSLDFSKNFFSGSLPTPLTTPDNLVCIYVCMDVFVF
jgi:hypothetical protein